MRMLRRAALIIILVVLSAALGAGVGGGIAVYILKNQNKEQSVNVERQQVDTSASSAPEAATVAKKIISSNLNTNVDVRERRSESASKEDENQVPNVNTTSGAEPPLPNVAPSDEGAAPQPKVAEQTSSGTIALGKSNIQPSKPQIGGNDINVPSIDLSKTVNLNSPSPKPTSTSPVPNIGPDLNTSAPSLSIGTVSEDEIKKVYYTKGIAEAERLLKEERKKDPKSSVISKYMRLIKLERQAMALEAQGDSEGAKRIWQQILKIAPDHPRAKARLGR